MPPEMQPHVLNAAFVGNYKVPIIVRMEGVGVVANSELSRRQTQLKITFPTF